MKPSIPKGTRDFNTGEMLRREQIFNVIRDVFRLHGYQPIETPAMENLSTLLGKYGEEGDKLIFRILNSGDFLSGIDDAELSKRNSLSLSHKISEKGLRYDLTVPFARFVVQHRDEIVFPFRRYQIQPVWRADRPQKGRYREFFQCDADVIGSDSLVNEFELVKIIDKIFRKLRINVAIKINNRKILSGISDYIGNPEKLTDITVAIDKLDKIGADAVNEELRQKGLTDEAITALQPILNLSGDTAAKLTRLEAVFENSEIGRGGVEEMRTLFGYIEQGNIVSKCEFDLTLARGLNYYTGAIIEVKALDMSIGSICGGGRYDNLTGIFGLPGVSGVGVSFGADRIYDVMTHLNLFNESASSSTLALVINFGPDELPYAMKITDLLRESGVSAELFPDASKIKKQFSYADSRKIPYIMIAGAEEIASRTLNIKIMSTGEQKNIPFDDLKSFIGSEILK